LGAVQSGAWIDGRKADSPELLPGEQPTSQLSEDAELWVAVYSELLDFLGGLPEAHVFQETIERYRGRLSFWRLRLDELSAGREIDEGACSVG
jgi:hypothetical protein